jgi:TolB-like protein
VRGDTGFVVWARAYERPAGEVTSIEPAIAADVGKALAGIAAT